MREKEEHRAQVEQSLQQKDPRVPVEEFSLTRLITQRDINLYAEASGDYNPIHIDPDFAARTPFGGTIAHGMLVLAYMAEMMVATFGQVWLQGGKLRARFKAAARPGDTLILRGRVRRVEPEGQSHLIKCEVSCRNQKGEDVVLGEAEVRLPQDS